jgi:hypothetical protein
MTENDYLRQFAKTGRSPEKRLIFPITIIENYAFKHLSPYINGIMIAIDTSTYNLFALFFVTSG